MADGRWPNRSNYFVNHRGHWHGCQFVEPDPFAGAIVRDRFNRTFELSGKSMQIDSSVHDVVLHARELGVGPYRESVFFARLPRKRRTRTFARQALSSRKLPHIFHHFGSGTPIHEIATSSFDEGRSHRHPNACRTRGQLGELFLEPEFSSLAVGPDRAYEAAWVSRRAHECTQFHEGLVELRYGTLREYLLGHAPKLTIRFTGAWVSTNDKPSRYSHISFITSVPVRRYMR